MAILVVAEHNNVALASSTSNIVGAATQLNQDVHIFVAGEGCLTVVKEASSLTGVSNVIHADDPSLKYQFPEQIAPLIVKCAEHYSHILAVSSTMGKGLIPRVAALLDTQPISDIIAIESSDTFCRPIYAGNIIARVKSTDSIKLLTVRATSFPGVEPMVDCQAHVEKLDVDVKPVRIGFCSEALSTSDRPEITAAKAVVSGGRGLGNGENFDLLYRLADKIGAAVGASRAAVDAGFVANDLQVGQTGKIVAPDLYIAVGISGAIQHLAGMKDSKVIVAINKDEDAPIFQVADYGLVADLFDVVPELTEKL